MMLAPVALGGCELMAMGPLMPGLVPGVGFPIQGRVRDGRTFLPIGGATVTSGLGSTVTDANGHFSLYGSLGSREISVSRAGYVATTLGGIKLDASGPLELTLSPPKEDNASLPTMFLEVQGNLINTAGQPLAVANGVAMLGDQLPTPAFSGAYNVSFKSQVPGKLMTRVLAGGETTGTWDPKAKTFQALEFKSFGYSLQHFALTELEGQNPVTKALIADDVKNFTSTKVNYTNLSGLTTVQTSVYLDFGVAGTVLVAQESSSNQQIRVPVVPDIKYFVIGNAFNASGTQSSTVRITTSDPSKAPFQMLTPPKVLGGVGKNIGTRPTFKWSPSTVPGVTYEVVLGEGDPKGGEYATKWIATTTDPEITYPGFSLADVNGGALRPEKQYAWSVRVIDTLSTMEDASSGRSVLDVKPLRLRNREAMTNGNVFTI